MHSGSIHELRADAFNYVWDNSFTPALEVESGESVFIEVRDASDEQIHVDSDVDAVGRLDFSHVNPVSGPIYRARRAARVTCSRSSCSSSCRGPGAGRRSSRASACWRTSFPIRGCASRALDAGNGVIHFSDQVTLPYRPFPGTIGVAPPEPGAHSVLPPSRFGGNLDTKHLNIGTRLLPPRRGRGRAVLARRHTRRAGRRRGLRHRDRDGDGRRRPAVRPP